MAASNKKRILVIAVDRDNDLFEKAKVAGPVIGRKANLDAAMKLAVADPEESDSNTMFEAIKMYDEVSAEGEAEIVTLTGDRRLGYAADKQIGEQLYRVLSEFQVERCIIVTDGASDEQVLPIIQSRLKIESVKTVVVKQAAQLERTYFVILEKLKEPYYRSLFFGLPALILIMFAISGWMGYGWQPVSFVVGLYLIIKMLDVDESLISMYRNFFSFSVERISLIIYIAAFIFIVMSFWLAREVYIQQVLLGGDPLKIAAAALKGLLLLLPWGIMVLIAGKAIDLMHERRRYELARYGMYLISIVLCWVVLNVASDWILARASFKDLVYTVIVSVLAAILSIEGMRYARKQIAAGMNLENKEVLDTIGNYVGKTIGVDRRRGVMIVQTQFGHKIDIEIDNIRKIGERVTIKT
ncbi:Uncharacterised protein [Candidatus Gugararchaeum adminiculabundum]|nr:Uncharacterised protein [Candidatus Gugararchaeum adminiculabundum]